MINSQKTILAYLDILGYKKMIEKRTPEDFYDEMENLFKLIRQLIDRLLLDQTNSNRLPITDVFFKSLRFKLLSDNIIIYCDLVDRQHINNRHYNTADYELNIVTSFFEMVSFFVVQFIARTGYLLRGGICFDKLYVNTFDSDLLDGELIFGEALVKGYELEQLAIYPRVLVDEPLANLWNTRPDSVHSHKLFKWLVQADKDGEMYFDYYESLRTYPEDYKKKFIPIIIKSINNMLERKEEDRHVWNKWHWFKEYHNEKMKSFAKTENQDLSELLVN